MLGTRKGAASKELERIIEAAGHKDKEEKFGVCLDEFLDLVDEEDVFDASEDIGPNPPIAETLPGHVPYCEIQLDTEDDLPKGKKKRRRKLPGTGNTNESAAGMAGETVKDQLDRIDTIRGGNTSFTVNQLAYNLFRPGYTVILYGPRRSGKSFFVRNIAQRLRPYFADVIVFTMTKSSGEYFGFVPYARVIPRFDEVVLRGILDHQEEMKQKQTRGERCGNYNILIIVDDCMAQGLRYETTFNMLFYNGRHLNVTAIALVQDVRGIAPSATINCDIACTFSLPDRRGRDTIREKFADYLSQDEFDRLYDSPQINKKFHIIAFDIAHRYNPIDKRVFIGCVDPELEEPFVLGDKDVWEGEESARQLEDLGMGYLLELDDWGIIQPDEMDPETRLRRNLTKKAIHNKIGPVPGSEEDNVIKACENKLSHEKELVLYKSALPAGYKSGRIDAEAPSRRLHKMFH